MIRLRSKIKPVIPECIDISSPNLFKHEFIAKAAVLINT